MEIYTFTNCISYKKEHTEHHRVIVLQHFLFCFKILDYTIQTLDNGNSDICIQTKLLAVCQAR